MPLPFQKVDCTESVEEALARLDLESKQKKLAKLAQTEEQAKSKTTTTKHLIKSNKDSTYDDPMSTETDKEREINFPLNDKARKLYPERGGDMYKSGWFDIMFKGEGREGIDKIKCERNVWKVIQKSKPLISILN